VFLERHRGAQGVDVVEPFRAEDVPRSDQTAAGCDHEALVRLQAAEPGVDRGMLRAEVRLVDRFGNVQLQARARDMESAGLPNGECVQVAGRFEATHGHTFADVAAGDLVVYEDSAGWVAVAMNSGSAAAALAGEAGSSLTMSPCAP